jgi:hypothetical protein
MIDAVETAGATGLSLQPRGVDEPVIAPLPRSATLMDAGFDSMIERWLALSYVMNNISRGLGQADSYPFVLSPMVLQKLRFIYDTINENRSATAPVSLALAARGLRAVAGAALITAATLAIVGIVRLIRALADRAESNNPATTSRAIRQPCRSRSVQSWG